MWTYETSVNWTEDRKGETRCKEMPAVEISTPVEFGGPEGFWTPEDLLTSAVATCILTSTLFFADRAKIVMTSYTSKGVSTMEKTDDGILITKVVVTVDVVLEISERAGAMKKAVALAEKTCPVSNSLTCPVEVILNIT